MFQSKSSKKPRQMLMNICYFKVVNLFTGEESSSTVCKSSPRVPTTSSPTSVWMAMRSVVLLALTNLTASHFLPHNSIVLYLIFEKKKKTEERRLFTLVRDNLSLKLRLFFLSFSNPSLHNSIKQSHDQGPHQF